MQGAAPSAHAGLVYDVPEAAPCSEHACPSVHDVRVFAGRVEQVIVKSGHEVLSGSFVLCTSTHRPDLCGGNACTRVRFIVASTGTPC